jgi:hypothetical protein
MYAMYVAQGGKFASELGNRYKALWNLRYNVCIKFNISTAGIPRQRKSGNIPKIIPIPNSILKKYCNQRALGGSFSRCKASL